MLMCYSENGVVENQTIFWPLISKCLIAINNESVSQRATCASITPCVRSVVLRLIAKMEQSKIGQCFGP